MSTRPDNNGTDDPPLGPEGGDANRTIYIRIVVDVDGVLQDRSQTEGDMRFPVSADSGRLIATATRGSADQTTGEVTIMANDGDTLRFFAVSGSNNFEDAVLIQNISGSDDEDDVILADAALVNLQQTALTPSSASSPGASEQTASSADRNFWFWQCAVAGTGTQTLRLILALYGRDEDGQPHHAGLCRWDLALTVSSPELPPDQNTSTEESTS